MTLYIRSSGDLTANGGDFRGLSEGDLGGFGPFGGVPCWSYDRNFPTVVSMWRCDAPIVRRAMSGQHQYYRSTSAPLRCSPN